MEENKLLQHWVDEGLAVADAGDGAWWTKLGLTSISNINRMCLSGLLYGKSVPHHALNELEKDGFNSRRLNQTEYNKRR